jgi:hypothetical protein
VTTRVFDVRPEVALSSGAASPVQHPLRGTLRETLTTSGTTSLREVRQFFLAALAAGSVLVRPSLEQRERCHSLLAPHDHLAVEHGPIRQRVCGSRELGEPFGDEILAAGP